MEALLTLLKLIAFGIMNGCPDRSGRSAPMTEEQQKEHFSIAYVRAVAAAARVNICRLEVDADSIDIGFVVRSVAGCPQSPQLDAQLKCVTELAGDETVFRYPLKAKNYNELIGQHYIPRILIVVLVPPLPEDWIAQSTEQMSLRRYGYWVSLRESAPRANTSSVTVELPREQLFSVTGLKKLLPA
jgi:hypothetical protein